jgi:hypothetical protein
VTFVQSELNIVEDLRFIYLYEINTVAIPKAHIKPLNVSLRLRK